MSILQASPGELYVSADGQRLYRTSSHEWIHDERSGAARCILSWRYVQQDDDGRRRTYLRCDAWVCAWLLLSHPQAPVADQLREWIERVHGPDKRRWCERAVLGDVRRVLRRRLAA